MANQVPTRSSPTAMPVIAGIIDIVIGAGSLLGLSVLGIAALVVTSITLPVVGFLIPLIGLPLLAVGVVAVVGGVFATQRRMWGWALAGSICAAIISNVPGIVAIVLVALSRNEFPNNKV